MEDYLEYFDDALFKKITTLRVLVAGEIGLDEYIWGETQRISPEAPVPIVEAQHEDSKLGLGANVAQNVVSMGGGVTLVGVCGVDSHAARLKYLLETRHIHYVLIPDASRPTIRKVRVISRTQQVLRIDYERTHELNAGVTEQWLAAIEREIENVDALIIEDYGKGVWNQDTIRIVEIAKQRSKPIFVDPSQNAVASFYRGVTVLTPNTSEAESLSLTTRSLNQDGRHDFSRLNRIATEILEQTGANEVIITCGEVGMVSLTQHPRSLVHVPAFARRVSDVTGAGDTAIALLTLFKLAGLPSKVALYGANVAAGLVVGELGTAVVTPRQFRDELTRLRGLEQNMIKENAISIPARIKQAA